ncbi:MAG: UDP-N-acetylglucosamine 1-carboxyvinyltransferase [Bacillota bacterium]|nr:UDP-N-acetylglucosamine 1-carboxyvinyltransferase [Bacillota bacterium]
MTKIYVDKSEPLHGSVKIKGAKNSVLKLIAASILAEDDCVIENVPDLLDVTTMSDLLRAIGLDVRHDKMTETITIKQTGQILSEPPHDIVTKIRASIVVMGPLLGKLGRAKIAMPGGCPIGARPIDLHIKGLRALGAEVEFGHGFIEITAPNGLIGSEVYLDFPSVGATENIMMAATRAQGTTTIQNAAKEPEIIDLANYLNKLGAVVRGAGTDTIRVTGVTKMGGATHRTVPDRLIAVTYMIAAAITKGEVTVRDVVPDHFKSVTAKLREMGVTVEEKDDWVRVSVSQPLKSVDLTTLPYPGIPTDVQAPFMALLAVTEGTSIISETVFENRFMHVPEFNRMGANIKIDAHSAVIQGVNRLSGAMVKATDLRCGAALVLAGLVADGTTEIDNVYHIDRGYPRIENDLRALGARIVRK